MNKPESQEQEQETIVTLEGDDGTSYSCQVLDIFEFENQEYVLLLNLGKEKEQAESEEGSIVIMRLTEKDNQSIFQTIETEEEFERVVAHVEKLTKEADA